MTEETKFQASQAATPFKNLVGAFISGVLATGLYFFTLNVAHKLAMSPFRSATTLTARIAVLVRTILLALGSGATMIFGVIALGLVLLTIQQLFQKLMAREP